MIVCGRQLMDRITQMDTGIAANQPAGLLRAEAQSATRYNDDSCDSSGSNDFSCIPRYELACTIYPRTKSPHVYIERDDTHIM